MKTLAPRTVAANAISPKSIRKSIDSIKSSWSSAERNRRHVESQRRLSNLAHSLGLSFPNAQSAAG